MEISLSPLQTDRGTLVSAAVRDITDRRRAEEALEEARQRRPPPRRPSPEPGLIRQTPRPSPSRASIVVTRMEPLPRDQEDPQRLAEAERAIAAGDLTTRDEMAAIMAEREQREAESERPPAVSD